MAREGEDDLRVFRWNSVDLVVEKTWRKFLKKFGEERKEFACLRGSCRAEDDDGNGIYTIEISVLCDFVERVMITTFNDRLIL